MTKGHKAGMWRTVVENFIMYQVETGAFYALPIVHVIVVSGRVVTSLGISMKLFYIQWLGLG